jgi:hypothetical protein
MDSVVCRLRVATTPQGPDRLRAFAFCLVLGTRSSTLPHVLGGGASDGLYLLRGGVGEFAAALEQLGAAID